MHKRDFLKTALVGAATLAGSNAAQAAPAKAQAKTDRAYMAGLLQSIPDPVLSAISRSPLR